MTRSPVYLKAFEKDVRRCSRRGKNLEKLKVVVQALLSDEPLDPLHRDHRLVGNYVGRRECHIEADWLVIYKIEAECVVFERTGTHADLFE